ncbi:MAG: hypothetical protein ACRD5K_04330 [Candidatus Acidiferrales bacterium]
MAFGKTRGRHELDDAPDENFRSPADADNSPRSTHELSGRGRLVPAIATGIEYPVEFGLKSPPAAPQHGRAAKPTRWTKCRIHSLQSRTFLDGFYFLRTEEGRVHQLKVINGVWHCLALAL